MISRLVESGLVKIKVCEEDMTLLNSLIKVYLVHLNLHLSGRHVQVLLFGACVSLCCNSGR